MATSDHWTQQRLPGERPPPGNHINEKNKARAFLVLTMKRFRFRQALIRQKVKHMTRKAKNKAEDELTDLFYKD
jgi:hypothetical protein